MILAIEWSDEFVTVPRGPLGELLGTGEIESDALERMRQGRHGLVSLISIMVDIMPRSGKDILIWISPKFPVIATIAQT
jgi:hypothetical protein